MWDLRTGAVARTLESKGAVTSIEVTPCGRYIVTADGKQVRFTLGWVCVTVGWVCVTLGWVCVTVGGVCASWCACVAIHSDKEACSLQPAACRPTFLSSLKPTHPG